MLAASIRSARLRADERIGSVAATSPMAKTSGRPGHLEGREDPHETLLVEQLGGQPAGVGLDPPDRPDHRVAVTGGPDPCSTRPDRR